MYKYIEQYRMDKQTNVSLTLALSCDTSQEVKYVSTQYNHTTRSEETIIILRTISIVKVTAIIVITKLI